MSITIATEEHNGAPVLKTGGEVDLYSSPQLRDALLKAISQANNEVHVDLGGVRYMDSSGVAVLVEGLKAAGKKNLTYKLVAPSQPVLKVLQLSRLDRVFTIEEA